MYHAVYNGAAVFPQPGTARFVVGQYVFNKPPKARGMVELFSVAQLMYYHIVDAAVRAKHQKAIKT